MYPEEPEISTVAAPMEYLSRYIPDCLYENMAEKTNIYALQKGVSSFKPTTSDEITTCCNRSHKVSKTQDVLAQYI